MYRTLRLQKPTFTLPLRPAPSSLPTNLRRPTLPASPASPTLALTRTPLQLGLVRYYAAGEKGPNPGPNPDHAARANKGEAQNATPGASDELRGMTRDFAKIISGGSAEAAGLGAREVSAHGHGGSVTEDFFSITKGMFTAVPKPVLLTGLAGTIPYLGTSVSIVALAREASLASQAGTSPAGLDLPTALSYLHTLEHVQITYGAIILSFLGALHWGMEFAKLGGEHGYRRLALGIAPVLIAWPTLMLGHGVALASQWFGFTFMWFFDQRATSQGWTTWWYSTYRFYLSIIVGFSIIGTLVGTSYYGAGAGAINDTSSPHLRHTTERISALSRLDKVKEKNYPKSPDTKIGKPSGKVAGDVQVDEEQSGEAFLKLRNVKREEEEAQKAKEEAEKKEKEEKEKKEKAKKQDEKESKQKDESPDGMKDGSKKRAGGEGEKEQKGGEEKKDDKKEEMKDDKKEEEKDDKDDKKEEKKDEGKEQKDNQGGDNKDGKQEAAAKEKGAAGEENQGMR
ncbi:hypothetical protein IAU60_006537 [Kwoniella sp. DSM 27419]